MRKIFARSSALAAVFTATVCAAATFKAIKEPECLNPSEWDGWTGGGQYNDPNNGVLQDGYSLLARWQGNDFLANPVYYDMSSYTGLASASQRGYQPEDPNGSPGAQVECMNFGMLLNTWQTAHRPIVGGGYNDMWGYAWSRSRPRPFIQDGVATDLVLQANLALPIYSPTAMSGASGQLSLFAYVRDLSHPRLPAIALLAGAYDSEFNATFEAGGMVGFDYSNYDNQQVAARYPNWISGAAGDGVWFVSGPISNAPANTNPYITTIYSQGQQTSALNALWNPAGAPMRFFRAHITPRNLINAVNAIDAAPCPGPRYCPARGYSQNPADYELAYAGVIAETTLKHDWYDESPTSWVANDSTKPQVLLSARGYAFGIYRYIP